MSGRAHLDEINGTVSLSFSCGELPADAAIAASGHEPNGYFWQGLVEYLAPALAAQVELDSEAGMFAAYGELAIISQLRDMIDAYLEDGGLVVQAIQQAEAAGFQFDD